MFAGELRPLVLGKASGPVTILSAPLSLWGGLDLQTGCICDVSHPEFGVSLSGIILAMPGARGSSSSSSALVEAVRTGTAPAGIILSRTDPILVIGGLVAADLYGSKLPILLADEAAWESLHPEMELEIDATADNAPARVRTIKHGRTT